MLTRTIRNIRSKAQSISKTRKNALFLTSAQYINSFLGAIKGIVLAKVLGPTLLGEVAAVNLVFSYGTNLHFGALDAMNRNVPYYRSRGEADHAEKIKNTAFTFSLVNALIAAFVVIMIVMFRDMSPFFRFGIIVFALCVPSYFVYNFNLALLRYSYDFRTIAIFQVLNNAMLVLISVIGCFFISNYAVVIGTFVAFWTVNFIYITSKRETFSLKIDWKVLVDVLKLGLPLFSLGFAATLISTIDRIVILKFMDSYQLGLYNFAMSMAVYYALVGTAVNSVVYQKMVDEYGRDHDRTILADTVRKSVIILVLLSPIFGFWLEGAVRFLIDGFLPKYLPSKAVLAIVIVPAFFKTASPFYNSGLITLGKHFVILRNKIFLIIVLIIMNGIFVGVMKMGIEGVAYATATLSVVNFILQYISFTYYYKDQSRNNVWLPLLLILQLGVVILVRHISLSLAASVLPGMYSALIYILIATVIYGGFVILLYQKNRERWFKST